MQLGQLGADGGASNDEQDIKCIILANAHAFGKVRLNARMTKTRADAQQVPAGFMADAFGGERVILLGLVAWSLTNVATPLAAGLPGGTALAGMIVVRAAFGVCQAAGQPSVSAVCAR